MRFRTKARIAAAIAAALTLALGAALTQFAAQRSRENAEQTAAASFQKIALQLGEAVEKRITTPRYGLGGFRSAISLLGHAPSAEDFRLAFAARDLSHEFPGVIGFGFIQPVSDADLPQFLAQMASDYPGTPLSKDQTGPSPHYIIRSIEPLSRNLAALGYDVGSNPARRQAVEAAIAPGSLRLTAPIHLVQIGPHAWGALYIMPAYSYARDNDPQLHPKQRVGWVYAAVDYPAALAHLSEGAGLASYTVADTTDPTPVPVFSSDQGGRSDHPALFTSDVSFELGSRRFTLHTASLPAFEKTTLSSQLPKQIRIGGGLASLLAAFLVFELILRQFRAVDLARKMTHDLDRLAAVGRLTNDAIGITDNQGRLTWVNPAFMRMTGQPEESLIGKRVADFIRLPDDASSRSFFEHLLQTRSAHRGEAAMVAADGRNLLTEIEIQPYVGRLATTTGLVVIQADITQRKRDERALRENMVFLDRTGFVAGVGGWQYELDTGAITWSAHTRRIHEVPEDFVPTLENAITFYPPEARATLERAIETAIATGKGWDLELPFITYRDREIWVRAMGVVELENDRPARLSGAFQDITRRKRNELELAESRELLSVTLNSIGDAVITTDSEGQVTWLNPVAETMVGVSLAEAEGKPITEVLPLVNQDTRHAVDNPILIALRDNRTVGLATNTILVAHDGTELGIEDSAAPIRDAHGKVIGGVMVFHDVTEARAIQREVSERARHDALTGLLNRHEFEDRLNRYMTTVDASWNFGAVFFIDLDHFKLVNDTGGHAAGDQLLCQIGQLIQSRVRAHDSVARLGGDEFAILLENCSMKNAEIMAQSICDAIDQYRFVANAGQVFRVGASLGVVSTDAAWTDSDELMRAADEACRAAKEAGRNRFHIWRSGDEHIQLRAGDTAWGVRLEEALDHDGFELFGQRIEALDPAHVDRFHVEVLLRMKDGDQPLIGPGLFMPAAERFHLANRLDRWVVQRVFEEISNPRHALPPGSMVSVNLSGQSVGDRAFHHFVRGLIDRAAFDPRQLCFEITETAAITNLASAASFLEAMRKQGIRLALDDFGAGVASFGYLRSLAVDFLKIDGQYIQGMGANPLDLVSIQSFCEVAKVLGIQTIAEFVETQGQFEQVRELGIHYAQGYFIHKPARLTDLLATEALPYRRARASDGGLTAT